MSTTTQWEWFDGENWNIYDDETAKQIEDAYQSGKSSVSLNKGSFFGEPKRQNAYLLEFFRKTNPHTFEQCNRTTSNRRLARRESKSIKPSSSLMSNNSLNALCQDLNNLGFNDNDDDDDKKQPESINERSTPNPYDLTYAKGDWIEICDEHNNWLAAEIINVEITGAPRNNPKYPYNKTISVEYEDAYNAKQNVLQLNLRTEKKRTRPVGGGFLEAHTFNFKYDGNANPKLFDAKNAKHPAAYINRKCFTCKGSGRIQRPQNNIHYPCNRCDGSGIYHKAFTLTHRKCAGEGCPQCHNTGKYPLSDWKCKFCEGSGRFYPAANKNKNKQYRKCPSSNTGNESSRCVSGYFINKVIPFTPKRDQNIRVHGAADNKNMKRLFHATDKRGAAGIMELGVMFRGNDGSYGGAIYFASNPRSAEQKARQNGYLVIADVYIGKCKNEEEPVVDMNFTKLYKMGYDSIKGNWSGDGIEYVVYNWDQVWVHIVLPHEKVNFKALKI